MFITAVPVDCCRRMYDVINIVDRITVKMEPNSIKLDAVAPFYSLRFTSKSARQIQEVSISISYSNIF